MSLTDEQEAAVGAPHSVAVLAGAGAGKTHMLAARYLRHLSAHGLRPLEVVAVTFTEKAARELRARIREEVRRELTGSPDYLAELEAAPISTIHALAARICREHPEEAGVACDFAILDDLDGQLWLLGQLDEALDGLPPPAGAPVPFGLLREALEAFLADPLAAEAALAAAPAAWRARYAEARQAALAAFLADPALGRARADLDAHAGAGPVEAFRLQALGALARLAHPVGGALEGAAAAEALAELAACKPGNQGKQADWPAGGLAEVKAALRVVKEAAEKASKAGLVALAWGPADDLLASQLPTLRQAVGLVRGRLAAVKHRARKLDFADLEVHALRALEQAPVRAYYQARWRAFLVDEFQDTNPVQARLIALLTAGARLTVVGDEKQAIYGFRRADAAVFRRVAAAIVADGGAEVTLGQSFRTHAGLVAQLNQVFEAVLGPAHRDLTAARTALPHPGPHLAIAVVEPPKGAATGACRRVEALHLARRVQALLAAGTPVHDKASGALRPLRPGDVAVLARAWAPLEAFAEAFAALGVPAVHAGGGDLLATREALDGWALLRVLANPNDSLALAAVLRGPWFAASDRALLAFAEQAGRQAWWPLLRAQAPPALLPAREALGVLLAARRHEPPSRLLQLADRLCGYTAVIANLPGAARREADWAGFVDFVRKLEGGGADADMVEKQLARLAEAEVEVPRPPLEAGNAVALMTIHAAKGLEWPVVVVPDLARAPRGDFKRVRLDPAAGVALKLEDELGEAFLPGLYQVLRAQEEARQADEARRLAYVALTRARDQVMLSAAAGAGGLLDVLTPGLEAAGCARGPIPYLPEDTLPPALLDPPAPALGERLLLGPVGPGLTTLPVTALSAYARCPLAFRLQHLEGHPGCGEGSGQAARVGTLTHLALEHDLYAPEALAPYDPGLAPALVAEAARLARGFHEAAAFAPVRGLAGAREKSIVLRLGKLSLRGVIDLVGPDFVLDYKTDARMAPGHHGLQLWAYARAEGHARAYLAYLRHGELVAYEGAGLQAAGLAAERAVAGILAGDFEARPALAVCSRCAYRQACAAGLGEPVEPLDALEPEGAELGVF